MLKDEIYKEIEAELNRAIKKFPTWPTDPNTAAAVVGEECGELVKATLETVYEFPKSTKEDIKNEAIQTAAMAIRFLISLDEYDYSPKEQHVQKL